MLGQDLTEPKIQFFGALFAQMEPRVATPAGRLCHHCSEAIEPSDSGTLCPDTDGGNVALHRACHLRMTLGSAAHQLHRCTCHGGDAPEDPPGLSRRQAAEAALAQWERSERLRNEQLRIIDEVGWMVILVGPGRDKEPAPFFAYTIGLYENYQHPELLIIGLPRPKVMHAVLNLIGSEIKAGKVMPIDTDVPGFLDGGYLVRFKPVPPEVQGEYTGQADFHYETVRGTGKSAPFLHVVYPDKKGRWPWDAEASELFRTQQPVLNVLKGP